MCGYLLHALLTCYYVLLCATMLLRVCASVCVGMFHYVPLSVVSSIGKRGSTTGGAGGALSTTHDVVTV
jgi:hypothetical protein